MHSIQELAAMARAQLDKLQPGYPQSPQAAQSPQSPQSPQPDWAAAEPQLGPVLGPGAQAQQGQMPGPAAQQGPMPGPAAQQGPMPGPPGQGFGAARRSGVDYTSDYDSPGQELFNLAMNETARFIGRAIGNRLQRTYTQQVQPTLAAHAESMLRTQIEIADKHPDVCACLNDGVIFLVGGQRTLPTPNLSTLTVEQADALVATLRSG